MLNVEVLGERGASLIDDENVSLNTAWSSSKMSALLANMVGENFLDNADFRGANPDSLLSTVVNQRGLLSYVTTTSSAYTLDRWFIGVNASLRVLDGGVQLVGVFGLVQRLEHSQTYFGKVFTLSAMINGIIYTTTFAMVPSLELETPTPFGFIGITHWGGVSSVVINNRLDNSAIIQAVKLELGTTSTLANDPPQNLGVELAKCQRHQLAIGNGTVNGMSFNLPNDLGFWINPPVTLRVNPAVQNVAALRIIPDGRHTDAQETGFNFVFVRTATGDRILIAAQKAAHGLTGVPRLWIPPGEIVILDANL